MKHLNPTLLVISFVIVLIACSALSVSSVAENYRWTLEALNPLSGIEAIAFVISYLLRIGAVGSYTIAICLLLIIGTAIYLVLSGITKLIKRATRH